MKIRSLWLIRLAAFLAALLVRCWMTTVRVRVTCLDGQQHPADPAQSRYVYCFWHDCMMAPLKTRAPFRVLISQHADGELIASICEHLGFGTIRGSTTRGGVEAILEMIRGGDQSSHLAVTPDGPRGPRHELQPGVILVASQADLEIVPVGVGFARAWRASSWDRFAVPLPGSTVLGVIGMPIRIPPRLDRAGINQWRATVEQEMLAVNRMAEDWAEQVVREGRHAKPPACFTSYRESA